MMYGLVGVCLLFVFLEDSGYDILVPGSYFEGESQSAKGETSRLVFPFH